MERNSDNQMARLCNRLMSTAQNALDAINYIVDEMEFMAQQNPDRDDIQACMEEIKAVNKASESNNWVTANHWGEHFDGVSVDETDDEDDEYDEEEDDSESETEEESEETENSDDPD